MAESAHRTCNTHRVYRLSCADYDGLVAAAAGLCQRCAALTSRPHIDHDHSLGLAAVRGLVCSDCNRSLAGVDSGSRAPDQFDVAYLAAAWHRSRSVPFVPDNRMPARTFRVRDRLWSDFRSARADQGEDAADVVRRTMRAYVVDPGQTVADLAAIRGGRRG